MPKAARHARSATRRRAAAVAPGVSATKTGAAEIGLITENSDEKASRAKWPAAKCIRRACYGGGAKTAP
jgi:hypothetical protein